MKTALALLAFIGMPFAALALSPGPAPVKLVRLFHIQRIENANELIYEARLTDTGFAPKDPIRVYWVMKAQDGRVEELSAIEKQKAYGVSVDKVTESEVIFTLRAFKGRKITVRRSGTAGAYTAKAFTQINDEDNELDHLYITTSSVGLFPVVAKVDIFGRPKANGTSEKETLIP